MLQEVELVPDPAHWLPPWRGAGLLQERLRDLLPPPQEWLHVPQPPQPPQLPCTATVIVVIDVVIIAIIVVVILIIQ